MGEPIAEYRLSVDVHSGIAAVRGPGRGVVYRLSRLELHSPDPAAVDAAAARAGVAPEREPARPGAWVRGAQGVYHLGELLARWGE